MGNDFYFKPFTKRLLPYLLLFLLIYTALEIFTLYQVFISQAKVSLEKTSRRINEDVVLKDGAWDVSSYNADSNISDGDPLYIITSEGFVIKRVSPIRGLLDLSRYSTIDNYSTPQTLTTVTNEKWRVFSLPIQDQGKPEGIIMVAVYDPEEGNLPEIDKHIQEIASQLRSQISMKNDSLDVGRIDVRTIPFNVSFQIVNRFNKVLLHSYNSNSVSRIPSFIDRSYIENQLKGGKERQVEDALTRKKFLTMTVPILDDKKSVAGIIVVGKPLDEVYSALLTFGALGFLMNIILALLSVPAVRFYIRRMHRKNEARPKERPLPQAITFMKKDCKLSIDQQIIDIPYASFQYYFCDALFSKPKKKWEADELLEVFGEEFGVEKWRKVYDTMVALDKKTSDLVRKLFMVKDKRYFINPQLLLLIKYSNS